MDPNLRSGAIQALNSSGFPFQRIVEKKIQGTQFGHHGHGWAIEDVERRVSTPDGDFFAVG